MEKSRVIIVPCDKYRRETVYTAMKNGINALGGLKSLIDPEEKILVKPNFLSPAAAEKAVTTHPVVIEAMFRILQEEGYLHVSYGDSPGHGSCEAAAEKISLPRIAEKYGVARANMEEDVVVDFPEGMTATSFHFARGVVEADAIINLCKMKTHALERVTGAVKNVYGFICGAHKAAGHVKYPNASIFARAISDIHRATDIRLHIMDGIIAMEGNGPSSGDPIEMGVMLMSTDPVALDAVYCHMINLDPKIVPTCAQGEAMGIGTYEIDNIVMEVVDGTLHKEIDLLKLKALFGNPYFKVDRAGNAKSLMGRVSTIASAFHRKPAIIKEKCVKCGICVEHCPLPDKALVFKSEPGVGGSEPPVYDYKKCIRCYCCQEMCPQKAIKVKIGR